MGEEDVAVIVLTVGREAVAQPKVLQARHGHAGAAEYVRVLGDAAEEGWLIGEIKAIAMDGQAEGLA